MAEKQIIVNVKDIAAVHNTLMQMHPSGEDIIGVANSVMTLRRVIETSPEYKECEEVQDAND